VKSTGQRMVIKKIMDKNPACIIIETIIESMGQGASPILTQKCSCGNFFLHIRSHREKKNPQTRNSEQIIPPLPLSGIPINIRNSRQSNTNSFLI
jgi:nucleoid DNA-binding protein